MPQTVEQPTMARILEVREEARDVRTLWLEHEVEFQPGRFVMIWIPRMDEKPYTLSSLEPGRIAVTVRRRGSFSQRLMDMKPGERVGIRGPYGRGYVPRPPGIIVAGGCGVATVAPLKDVMPEAVLIAGAKTADELLFRERFPDMQVCTDDGSVGHAGLPTDLLQPRLEAGDARTVYTCGPEVMMRAVFLMCEKYGVECQAGLERYMKCGFGVCGQCTCSEMLVCRDGPVFCSEDLRRMPEFGNTARLKSGRRVSVQEYTEWRSS